MPCIPTAEALNACAPDLKWLPTHPPWSIIAGSVVSIVAIVPVALLAPVAVLLAPVAVLPVVVVVLVSAPSPTAAATTAAATRLVLLLLLGLLHVLLLLRTEAAVVWAIIVRLPAFSSIVLRDAGKGSKLGAACFGASLGQNGRAALFQVHARLAAMADLRFALAGCPAGQVHQSSREQRSTM